MSIIDLYNSNVSDALNKSDDFYETWFGAVDFTPEPTIVDSEDVNCGALCNELEFARLQTLELTESLQSDVAAGTALDTFINAFVDLPRRGRYEADAVYRSRLHFLVRANTNYRRITKWAIRDAVGHFMDVAGVDILEFFDTSNLYFQLRIVGAETDEGVILYINNIESGFLDFDFMGGIGTGGIVSYLGSMLDRIKAAGVDYDILLTERDSMTKTSDAIIGTVHIYKTSDAIVQGTLSFTKTSDGEIV